MAESYGFFDAEELVGGEFDREYLAEQFANYFKLFIGNGVFASPTNQLKVVAGTGLQIILKRGWAFINGYWYYNDDDLEIPVPANVTAQTVNSGVFVQFNSADRTIHTVIATGRTTVDRDAPYYELKLAELSVATGTTAISDAMITDTRTNENVCGFVKGLLDGVISTDDLFAQYTAIFNEWFDHMKDQLSEDAAGNLQEQIDEIDETLNNLNASTVSFDDTTAQIGSNTVQGAIEGLKSAFSNALTALKNTAIAQAVGATGSTFTSVISTLATIKDSRTRNKVANLTNQDGRRVHPYAGLWRTTNSDGTVRTCMSIPEAGYYDAWDIIGATDAQIKTLGWLIPSGNKNITANGSNIDVKANATVSVNVNQTPSYRGYSPVGTNNYYISNGDSYNDGGCRVTVGQPSVSKNGSVITVTIPETVRYGGYWLVHGEPTLPSQVGEVSRNITVTLNI